MDRVVIGGCPNDERRRNLISTLKVHFAHFKAFKMFVLVLEKNTTLLDLANKFSDWLGLEKQTNTKKPIMVEVEFSRVMLCITSVNNVTEVQNVMQLNL